MKAQITRNYPMSDDRMLQTSSLVSNLYEEDHTYYNKRYPTLFPEDFKIILKEHIASGYKMHSDEHARHQILMEGIQIKESVKKFKKKHSEIEPFIKRALADNEMAKKMLGIGTLSKMTETPSNLLLAIGHFLLTLRTYEQELRNYGLSDGDIAAFVAIEAELQTHRDDHDLAKLNRQDMTVQRINHFNEIWAMVKSAIDSAPAVLPEARAAKYKITTTDHKASETKTDSPDDCGSDS